VDGQPTLVGYLRVLEAHGWVQVPRSSDTKISYFVRGTNLLDRIEVVRGRWAHRHFNGTDWVRNPEARGADAASLDVYLWKGFRSGRK